ncbi:MAG: undecaprenyl diphosphate synthase family protein, partial [Thermoanaerobaculia bacterium]|nr:undecaprenyl diphosphate synthase family protein [Thermoanaerobaculia bacterium]
DPALKRVMERAEERTRGGLRLHLRIALDYSARHAIAAAARRAAAAGSLTLEEIERRLAGPRGGVDLLVRTGGEKRLSDFLLWECAYAELWFTRTMWPDFGPEELGRAVAAFRRRQRRFGGLAEGPAAASALPALI